MHPFGWASHVCHCLSSYSFREGNCVWDDAQPPSQFSPSLCNRLHQGLIVNAWCLERAMWSAMVRIMRQRVKLYYKNAQDLGWHPDEDLELLVFLEWNVTTCCAHHDCQHSIKQGPWGVSLNWAIFRATFTSSLLRCAMCLAFRIIRLRLVWKHIASWCRLETRMMKCTMCWHVRAVY